MSRWVDTTLAVSLVTLATVAGSGCEVEQGYDAPTASGDPDDWGLHVQPYVAPRCGTLDCHGDPGRPFRLYSVHGLRADPDRAVLLTTTELEENATAALGISPFADPDSHALVLSPLATASGGWHHIGGEIWPTRDAPGYLCLSRWLRGVDPSESCAAAARAVPQGTP